MKLIIIGPSRYNDDGTVLKRWKIPFPRLNLLSLASLTPDDIEISVVDEIVQPLDLETDCDLVAVTALTCQAPRAYDIADYFRKRGKKVVMGGIHASALPEEALKHVDSVVLGEADFIWKDVINDFKNNKLKLTYKSYKFHDLNGLPVPRYDLINKSLYSAGRMPVQATRGCPHNCDFCTVTKFFGGSYRFAPVDEVIRNVKATNAKRIFFVDDNIIANRAYANELFTKLIPLNIRWAGQSTIHLGRFPALCKLMDKSGCEYLVIGVESVNQASLDSVSKPQNNVEEHYKLLQVIKENGISALVQMIVGFDSDGDNIFYDTSKFLVDIKPFLAAVNVPIPYPGTRFTKKLEDENRILHKNWSMYRIGKVLYTPKLMTKEQLEARVFKTFKEFYNFNSIVKRSLSQPRKNIVRSFFVNLLARKFVRQGEWINAG